MVPLPRPGEEKTTRPDVDEVSLVARAFATAAAPPSGLTDLQRLLIEALCPALTDHQVDVSHYEPITPDEYAEGMRDRNLAFRTRGVQMMVLCALVLKPLPFEVAERIERFATVLGVEEGMVGVARRFATGSLGLAAMDFEREAEIEVFALIARANDDMRAFSLLAMVVSLFETGYLRTGAGLFHYDLGHLSHGRTMAVRLADALRRGAWCHDQVTGDDSIDYLRLDWFGLADQPVDEVRRRFGLRAKSAEARDAGSVGPWEAGGISPFQMNAGRGLAARDGRTYDSYGAELAG